MDNDLEAARHVRINFGTKQESSYNQRYLAIPLNFMVNFLSMKGADGLFFLMRLVNLVS